MKTKKLKTICNNTEVHPNMISTAVQFQTTQSSASLSGPFSLPISTDTHNYGILKLKTPASSGTMTQDSKNIHFIMNVDRSGSMDNGSVHNFASTGYSSALGNFQECTKMGYLKQTLRNMVRWFSEQEKTFYITIILFDDKIEIPIEHHHVQKSNVDAIIETINKIYSRNTTNFELALKTAKDIINKYTCSDEIQSQIFMTDGEITSGNSDSDYLKTFIDGDKFSSFIGFGTDHNVEMLKTLSSNLKSEYYFIDSKENTGMVYGEIIHNVVSNFANNFTIEMFNEFEIYDYKLNRWSNHLTIGSLSYNSDKIYYIRYNWDKHGRQKRNIYTTQLNAEFKMSYLDKEQNEFSEIIHKKIKNRISDDFNDFHGLMPEKYMWRLKTLELMFESEQALYKYDFMYSSSNLVQTIKTKLKLFFQKLKSYMERHNLQKDSFMTNLCDDIFVCIKSQSSHLGKMFIGARQSSQGQQRAYNTTTLEDLIASASPIKSRHFCRFRRVRFDSYSSHDDDNFDEHEVSQENTTPYAGYQQSQLMRSLSNHH